MCDVGDRGVNMSTIEIFKLQAEFCQRMSNPSRIQILHALREGPSRVSDLAAATGMPAGTVSRHLSVLRSGELVTAERNGQEMVYAIVNPKIVEICDLMRTVLAEQLRRHAAVAETFDSSSEA